MTVLLRLAYDGTEFHGYAAQRARPDHSHIRTVQGELDRALSTIYKQPVRSWAASRTDAGVHAQGQLAKFEPPFAIPPRGLALALNSHLPADVVVLAAWQEPGDVDIRRGNGGKHYCYRLRCTTVGDPCAARFEWRVARSLDVAAMSEAAQDFVGQHNFGTFRASRCQSPTTVRRINSVTVESGRGRVGPLNDPGQLNHHSTDPAVDWVEIHVRGEAFLMHMVRIMVGTMVGIGTGQRANDIPALLARPDRTRAGITAPARGLTLVEVKWNAKPVET